MNNLVRTMLLLEGSTYLHTNIAAINYAKEDIGNIEGAVILGDIKKIGTEEDLKNLGIPVIYDKNLNSIERIKKGLEVFHPKKVYDLTGAPTVLSFDRNKFAPFITSTGAVYEGLDFSFTPERSDLPLLRDFILHRTSITTLGFLGCGKRVGKTSVMNSLTKFLGKYKPIVITMGRGGPIHPKLISSEGLKLAQEHILELSKKEEHICSDNWQTALSTGFPVIGCFRVGEAYRTGVAAFSNLWTGTKMAEELKPGLIIYQGSGISRPPVRLHGEILIIGGSQNPDHFGKIERYSIIKADMIIITACEPPGCDRKQHKKLRNFVNSLASTHLVLETVFRPKPLLPENFNLNGKNLIFFTTSPENSIKIQKEYLEEKYGCHIVGYSTNLGNKKQLSEELEKFLSKNNFDTVLTEFKACAITVIEKMTNNGKKVIICENEVIPKDNNELEKSLGEVIGLAFARNS